MTLNEETKKKQPTDLKKHLVKALRNCSADGKINQLWFLQLILCTAASLEEMLGTQFEVLRANIFAQWPNWLMQGNRNVSNLIVETLEICSTEEEISTNACRIFSNFLAMAPGSSPPDATSYRFFTLCLAEQVSDIIVSSGAVSAVYDMLCSNNKGIQEAALHTLSLSCNQGGFSFSLQIGIFLINYVLQKPSEIM